MQSAPSKNAMRPQPANGLCTGLRIMDDDAQNHACQRAQESSAGPEHGEARACYTVQVGEPGRAVKSPAADECSEPGRVVLGIARLDEKQHDSGALSRADRREIQSRRARSLARLTASRLTGGPTAGLEVAGGRDTAPRLSSGEGDRLDITLSLSHSGPTVAAAAARNVLGVGVDVEQTTERRVDGSLTFMGWADVLGCGEGRASLSDDAFTQLWTLWEASVKCEGIYLLSRKNRAFDALAAGCGPGLEAEWSQDQWRALSFRPAPGFWLSLVVRGTARLPRLGALRDHVHARETVIG